MPKRFFHFPRYLPSQVASPVAYVTVFGFGDSIGAWFVAYLHATYSFNDVGLAIRVNMLVDGGEECW